MTENYRVVLLQTLRVVELACGRFYNLLKLLLDLCKMWCHCHLSSYYVKDRLASNHEFVSFINYKLLFSQACKTLLHYRFHSVHFFVRDSFFFTAKKIVNFLLLTTRASLLVAEMCSNHKTDKANQILRSQY